MNVMELKTEISHAEQRVSQLEESVAREDAMLNDAKVKLAKLGIELNEAEKYQSGKLQNKNDLRKCADYWHINPTGIIAKNYHGDGTALNKKIVMGNLFFDRFSAEEEMLKRKVLHKLWCEFGDDVVVIPEWLFNELKIGHNRGIRMYWDETVITTKNLHDFVVSLTEEERESLR